MSCLLASYSDISHTISRVAWEYMGITTKIDSLYCNPVTWHEPVNMTQKSIK